MLPNRNDIKQEGLRAYKRKEEVEAGSVHKGSYPVQVRVISAVKEA